MRKVLGQHAPRNTREDPTLLEPGLATTDQVPVQSVDV
jgi:hypothetical protein